MGVVFLQIKKRELHMPMKIKPIGISRKNNLDRNEN